MAKKVPLHSITVIRDGKRVTAVANKPFDFTAEEIKQIKESEDVEGQSLRDPINETPAKSDESESTETKTATRGRGAVNKGADDNL